MLKYAPALIVFAPFSLTDHVYCEVRQPCGRNSFHVERKGRASQGTRLLVLTGEYKMPGSFIATADAHTRVQRQEMPCVHPLIKSLGLGCNARVVLPSTDMPIVYDSARWWCTPPRSSAQAAARTACMMAGWLVAGAILDLVPVLVLVLHWRRMAPAGAACDAARRGGSEALVLYGGTSRLVAV